MKPVNQEQLIEESRPPAEPVAQTEEEDTTDDSQPRILEPLRYQDACGIGRCPEGRCMSERGESSVSHQQVQAYRKHTEDEDLGCKSLISYAEKEGDDEHHNYPHCNVGYVGCKRR